MKKVTQIMLTIAAFLLTHTIAFSQEPTDFGSSSTLTDTNATDVASIDNYIWVLILVGFGLVFSKYKTRYKS